MMKEHMEDDGDIILYRGICVSEGRLETVKSEILSSGLSSEDSKSWKLVVHDVQPRLAELIEKPDLTSDDTRARKERNGEESITESNDGTFPAFCACGDLEGASYYALHHNRNEGSGLVCPLVIEFRVKFADVRIDGRDFLFPAFQFGTTSKQAAVVKRLFGDAAGRYFERVRLTDTLDQLQYRVAMCDLASQDPEVIRGHYRNPVVIRGRYGVTFRSAFFVRSPVLPTQIVCVRTPEPVDLFPEVRLEEFRNIGGESPSAGQ